MLLDPNGPQTLDAVTNEAVADCCEPGDQEAEVAKEALVAKLAVPNKDPVILPLTLTEPVNSNTSALIVKSFADDAVKAFIAQEAVGGTFKA